MAASKKPDDELTVTSIPMEAIGTAPWVGSKPSSESFARGDRCIYGYHTHGRVARVMAVAEGYAMLRYKGCNPFVAPVAELTKVTTDAAD